MERKELDSLSELLSAARTAAPASSALGLAYVSKVWEEIDKLKEKGILDELVASRLHAIAADVRMDIVNARWADLVGDIKKFSNIAV